MKTVPDNSIVAVLSTSAILLPASTADNPVPETSQSNAEKIAGDVSNDPSSEETPCDIFVAYERMKISSSILPAAVALNNMNASSGSHTEAARNFGSWRDVEDGFTDGERAKYDAYGRARQRSNIYNQNAGLLVTASPTRLTTGRQNDHGDDSTTSSRGVIIDKIEATGRRRLSTGWARQPAAAQEPAAIRLSDLAPLPLLVFDSETFLALGELDERFAFHGGIAEWISRAEWDSGDQGRSIHKTIHGYCCPASSRHCGGAQGSKSAASHRGTSARSSCRPDRILHVHEQAWGRRYFGLWPGDAVACDAVTCDAVQSRTSTAEQSIPGTHSPSVDLHGGFRQQDQAGEQVFLRKGGDGDRSSQPRDSDGARKTKEVILDQRNRISPAILETLLQSDADLFFLPLLLLRQSSGEITRRILQIHDPSCRNEDCFC